MSDPAFEVDYDYVFGHPYPLKNNPEKYPFKPVIPAVPTRFLKENITQSDLTTLRTQNSNNTSANKISNEVNEIKYRVLYANNLGQKNYEHQYFVESDSTSVDDYFIEILDNLIDIFPNSTIEYTLLKDGHKAIATSNKSIHTDDYNNKKSANITITQKDNIKYSVTNTIKISWT
jgi:hypothetical protein